MRRFRSSAFSLVEVTLALGVAAVSLLIVAAMLPIGIKTNQASANQTIANGIISQIADDLRAAARLPPGQVSKQFSLDPSKGIKGRWDPTPQYIYFDYDARPTNTNPNLSTAPSDALYRVTLTYRQPPVDTTSLADLKVTWPAAQSDVTKVAGSVEMFVAINR
jgi:type II secretory pathway pseudopilin PulG